MKNKYQPEKIKKQVLKGQNKKNIFKKCRKNNIKIFKVLILCCISAIVLVSIIMVGCNLLVKNAEHSVYVYSDVENYIDSLDKKDYVIVPGAAVTNEQIGVIGKERISVASDIYKAGYAEKIIVSAGSEEETDIMVLYLEKSDIPCEDILVDNYGTNTYATIARAKEKYSDKSFYFCTQEMYSDRAAYLIDKKDIDVQIVCVDTMYYQNTKKAEIREIFANVKAVFEPIIRLKKTKVSVKQQDYKKANRNKNITISNGILDEEADMPDDCFVEDINKDDGYDVKKAVDYARKYAFDNNTKYPLFEMNCTNFISQCLLEGGIKPQGEAKISEKDRYKISKSKNEWYSISDVVDTTGRIHYSTASNFINTEKFIKYFTDKRGYRLSVYNNDYEGKLKCYNEIASGDILIFYEGDNKISHLGIVTGKGDMNAYYCSNTNSKRDYSVFTMNDEIYYKMGILHMSE